MTLREGNSRLFDAAKRLTKVFASGSGESPDDKATAVGLRMSPLFLFGTVLFLALLWAFDLFFLRTPILTPLTAGGRNLPPLTPLYAFWEPVLRPEALWFLGIAALCVLSAPFRWESERVSPVPFAIGLCLLFCTLAGTLHLIREPLSNLGQNLMIYPKEEVYYDAIRIQSLSDFITYYRKLQPQLSMRGHHYPPGGAVLLYLVNQLFGKGLWKIGAAILLLTGTGVAVCYAAIRQIVPEIRARQAALLLVACPSLLDFACTSMDAVFFFFACLSMWPAFLLAKRQQCPSTLTGYDGVLALLTGVLLYLACFISFAAIPLGMCLVFFLLLNGRRRLGRSSILSGVIATGFVLILVAVQLAWGYSLIENFWYAREHNFDFMASVLKRPVSSVYFYACYGNIAGFLIGSGIALTGAALRSTRLGFALWTPWMVASASSLLIMSIGGMFLMETERIWLFAMPWLALFAIGGCQFQAKSLRLLIVCSFLQAFFMESLLFTLW